MAPARAHPLARRLWAIIRDRSTADRRLVFSALQGRLGIGETTQKQDLAIRALRHHMEVHDSQIAPSRHEWDRFRSGQAEPRLLPSASYISSAFGSWSKARSVAEGSPQPDPGSLHLVANGPAFKRLEVIEAIRRWAEEVADPEHSLKQNDFVRWSQEQRDSGVRLPLGAATLNSVIGPWREALAEIGQAHRAAQSAAERGPGSPGGPGRPNQFTNDELAGWLRKVASDTTDNGRTMSSRGYERLRKRSMQEALDEGREIRIPSAETLMVRLGEGHWLAAKKCAGLDHALPDPEPLYSDAELCSFVREAAADHAQTLDDSVANPKPLTDFAYRGWRAKRMKELRDAGEEPNVPCSPVLRQRLARRWTDILKIAGVTDGRAGSSDSEKSDE